MCRACASGAGTRLGWRQSTLAVSKPSKKPESEKIPQRWSKNLELARKGGFPAKSRRRCLRVSALLIEGELEKQPKAVWFSLGVAFGHKNRPARGGSNRLGFTSKTFPCRLGTPSLSHSIPRTRHQYSCASQNPVDSCPPKRTWPSWRRWFFDRLF